MHLIYANQVAPDEVTGQGARELGFITALMERGGAGVTAIIPRRGKRLFDDGRVRDFPRSRRIPSEKRVSYPDRLCSVHDRYVRRLFNRDLEGGSGIVCEDRPIDLVGKSDERERRERG